MILCLIPLVFEYVGKRSLTILQLKLHYRYIYIAIERYSVTHNYQFLARYPFSPVT